VENTTTMVCKARKTNKQTTRNCPFELVSKGSLDDEEEYDALEFL
jgi:hypothetical protein